MMRFGATYHINRQGTMTRVAVTKVRDYNEYVNEIIHENRVQIMKIQDFDTLMEKLHIEHALQDHGGWVEYRNNKMYAVLCWIEKKS